MQASAARSGRGPARLSRTRCGGARWARLTPPLEIRTLLPRLSFVRDKSKWGFAFMSGWREISAADFAVLTGGA